jgi:steroid 5-alpha reductase family enzyme
MQAFEWSIYFLGLVPMVLLVVGTWLVSLIKRDASIVDSVWALLLLSGGVTYAVQYASLGSLGARQWLVLGLLVLWSLRLTIYITVRNWGEAEDHRYQKIRANNQPNFAFKSLYIVFLFQALLAWLVSLPLLSVATSMQPISVLDCVGAAVVVFGVVFESIGDWQLSNFKADPSNRGRVLDSGLWRYTRHPNYFGECCVWWGFVLIAISAGGWWSVLGTLLMTLLLLKVSGVSLLEKDIATRRPEYRRYIETTNAFIPGPRRLK